MKYIIAVIKPFKQEEVRKALNDVGIQGMTASEVKGFGRQKGHKEIYRGAEYTIDQMPKMKLEIAVPDEKAGAVLQAIKSSAATGEIGDGKIFVMDLGQVVRIRTGETGEDAL